ncbi:hypothetical protein [Chondrinema litorale]|uniref:hypothetical protein n=1 Tax=Chondrinema litorale TaxID=2994555 RepID=UPI0025434D1B|nr:hypothetical protein [Chondrinema litorale]UZR93828.1 hypothetical protein OQ292_18435 [Chondrinema litorale]
MKKEQCPICYSELETKTCAPCDDCGLFDVEIEHFHQKIHTYTIYNIYKDLKLQLCNLCYMEFGSYSNEYLGFKKEKRLNLIDFEVVKQIHNPQLEIDKFCPDCYHRLKFLKFIIELRELADKED